MSDEQAPKEGKKGKSKLVVLGIPIFLLLAGGGGGAWWYLNRPAPDAAAEGEHAEGEEGEEGEDEEETSSKGKPKEPPGVISLDPFTVNLADPGGRRYLRVKMALVVKNELLVTEFEEAPIEISRLRSALIELLTTQTSQQLGTAEGRAELRAAVAEAVKAAAHLKVNDVLFEEFLVQ